MIRPQFFADRRTGPEPSGKAHDPYDRSRELTGAEDDEECGVVTRTRGRRVRPASGAGPIDGMRRIDGMRPAHGMRRIDGR
ncbi:hypothetical protein ACF1AE_11810 [Streptomyces sp. NPDC014986]|uniref:hypothetical protein n=1 Tax=Streptomyces sp. NPDC014986 TaxID=3364934 RepID=UPI0036F781D4